MCISDGYEVCAFRVLVDIFHYVNRNITVSGRALFHCSQEVFRKESAVLLFDGDISFYLFIVDSLIVPPI